MSEDTSFFTKLRNKFSKKSSDKWLFEGENNYNFQFKISMPINNGYRETGIINVVVPANSAKQAKNKLNKFVMSKIQITVVNVKENQK